MEHTLTIKKIIAGGRGLGTLADGIVVMAAGVLPGETVVVRETKAHRGHLEAELVRVVEPSPERVAAPCPYYGDCGGCDLQHASYPAQLRIKQQIVRESLERARLDLPEDQPEPALPSPAAFGYRHRVRLHLDQAGQLGFHRAASNRVVRIRRCLLATEAINRVIEALAAGDWPERCKDLIGALEILHCPASGRVFLVAEPRPGCPPAALMAVTGQLAGFADRVLIHGEQSDRNPAELSQAFVIQGRPYRLAWDHRCFFQVNAAQNPRLIELALDLPEDRPALFSALDLFCGMGNFSIPLGLLGARVTGVEHNRQSIDWAGRNSRDAGQPQARFIAADVGQHLKTLVARKAVFDCILLDPPRQGLGKPAGLLPLLRPERIIAISCDPATLARDLALITAGGYRLTRITPVDMFPQTHHIESVAFLERN